MKQWWKKKIGSSPAVSFSPMSPLAPGIGEKSAPAASKPPTARWILLCGLSSGTACGALSLQAADEVVLENTV
jgi:hypothetical protein